MEINGLEKKEGFPKKYRLTGDKEISEIVRNGKTVGDTKRHTKNNARI